LPAAARTYNRGFVNSHRFSSFIVLLALGPALHGQPPTVVPATEPEMAVGLAPGDTLEAHFLDFPEAADMRLTVSSHGTIFVPYAGQVKVEGLMPEEAEEAVIEALKAKDVVKSPQVSINVISARNLSVLVFGAVSLPHQVPLLAPAPLSLVLSQVGPFTEYASYHVLIAHRDGSPPVDLDLDRTLSNLRTLNVMVQPGDIISVAQAGSFFALGEFNHPGIFPIIGTQHMTLMQAVAVAGGPTLVAALSKARILRTVDGRREEIDVDLAKLHDGKVDDPLIKTDDILFVPRSNGKVVMNSWLNQSLYALNSVNVVRSY
jgi:polysaccharide export outer membrane protein